MRRSALLLLLPVTVGCSMMHRHRSHASPSEMPSGHLMTGLVPEGGSTVRGTVAVTPGNSAGETHAEINVSGSTPGAAHPWHIHRGKCGDNGPIVGPAASYAPLIVGNDGTASAVVSVPMAFPSGALYVNVHMSSAEMGAIIACGNLQGM